MLTNTTCSSKTPASIHDLIEQKEWDKVVSILQDEECRKEVSKIRSDGWTVLHGLMESYGQDTPAIEQKVLGDIVDGFLESNPELLKSEHSDLKDLPLHSALRNHVPMTLITKLICGYPEAVDTKNAGGSYPRDLCGQGAYDGKINALYLVGALVCLIKNKLWRKASEFIETDKGRRSAKVDATLDIAIEYGAPNPLLHELIIAYPDALKKKVKGKLPLHCAIEANNVSPEIIELMIRLHPCALDRKGGEEKSGREMALETMNRNSKTEYLIKLIEMPTSYWKALPLKDAKELKQAKSKIAKLEEMLLSSEARQKLSEEKNREIGDSKELLSRKIAALRKQIDDIRTSERNLISIISNGQTATSNELREIVSSLNDRLDSIEAKDRTKSRTMESDLISSAAGDSNMPSSHLLKLLGYVNERIAEAEGTETIDVAVDSSSSQHASKKRKVNM